MADGFDNGAQDGGGNGVRPGGGTGDVLSGGSGKPAAAERAGDIFPPDSALSVSPPDADLAGRDSDEWATPEPLYSALDKLYGPFEFDLFASADNAKTGAFFSKEQDALKQDWSKLDAQALFANPPYSRGFQEAVALRARALAETTPKRICLLLQSVTETAWFHDALMRGGDLHTKACVDRGPLRGVQFRLTFTYCFLDLHLLRGRVVFIDPLTGKPAPGSGKTGSLIAAFRPRR